LSILFLYIICNFAAFRICLVKDPVDSLSSSYGLLSAMALPYGVKTTQVFTKML